jgi:hypothetical protein
MNLTANKTGSQQSAYVMFDTDDCSDVSGGANTARRNMVVVNPDGVIVWYLDIQDATDGATTTGWHYQTGTGTQTGRFLVDVDHRWMYDFNFDGTTNRVIDSGSGTDYCNATSGDDGPCFSHDAFRSDQTPFNTYIATTYDSNVGVSGTAWNGICTGGETFTDDGYRVYDNSGAQTAEYLLSDYAATDWDPTFGDSPNDGVSPCTGYWALGGIGLYDDVIDWTHINSVSAFKSAGVEYVDISLKEYDQVARFDNAGVLKWTLSGTTAPDDLTLAKAGGITGATAFAGQHDLHTDASGNYVMFDNLGDTTAGTSRGLHLALTGGGAGAKTTATIDQSWIVVNPASINTGIYCMDQGSAEMIGTSMLLDCNDSFVIEELASTYGDGTTNHQPDLSIELRQGDQMAGGTTDICGDGAAGGADDYPTLRTAIHGWYRAYPLTKVGEY